MGSSPIGLKKGINFDYIYLLITNWANSLAN
jgi:hypothetical protein